MESRSTNFSALKFTARIAAAAEISILAARSIEGVSLFAGRYFRPISQVVAVGGGGAVTKSRRIIFDSASLRGRRSFTRVLGATSRRRVPIGARNSVVEKFPRIYAPLERVEGTGGNVRAAGREARIDFHLISNFQSREFYS